MTRALSTVLEQIIWTLSIFYGDLNKHKVINVQDIPFLIAMQNFRHRNRFIHEVVYQNHSVTKICELHQAEDEFIITDKFDIFTTTYNNYNQEEYFYFLLHQNRSLNYKTYGGDIPFEWVYHIIDNGLYHELSLLVISLF